MHALPLWQDISVRQELLPTRSSLDSDLRLDNADTRSASSIVELVILIVVLGWSGFSAYHVVAMIGTGWEGSVIAGESVLSWAGEAMCFISTPLFLFLVLRWIWRFMVWTGLLFRISRLALQLMPLHPDRAGGLGFLANFPGIFNGFIFALSSVVAAAMIKDLGIEEHAAETLWFALAAWLVISVGLVISPLLVFSRPLYDLRESALIDYGRLASQHHLIIHQKWITGKQLVMTWLVLPTSLQQLTLTRLSRLCGSCVLSRWIFMHSHNPSLRPVFRCWQLSPPRYRLANWRNGLSALCCRNFFPSFLRTVFDRFTD